MYVCRPYVCLFVASFETFGSFTYMTAGQPKNKSWSKILISWDLFIGDFHFCGLFPGRFKCSDWYISWCMSDDIISYVITPDHGCCKGCDSSGYGYWADPHLNSKVSSVFLYSEFRWSSVLHICTFATLAPTNGHGTCSRAIKIRFETIKI